MLKSEMKRTLETEERINKQLRENIIKSNKIIDALEERLQAGRNYLMTVRADEITAEDVLEQLGFGRSGYDAPIY